MNNENRREAAQPPEEFLQRTDRARDPNSLQYRGAYIVKLVRALSDDFNVAFGMLPGQTSSASAALSADAEALTGHVAFYSKLLAEQKR